jgi:flagellar protein FlaG
MSTDTTSSVGSAAFVRPPAVAPSKGPRSAEPSAVDTAPAPKLAVPDKPQLTLDPQQRKRDLSNAIEQVNLRMREDGRALSFSMDETADRLVVIVKNSETGKVVRQLPDEALLRVAHHLDDLKGMFQDERI